jgi:hypothetical protein
MGARTQHKASWKDGHPNATQGELARWAPLSCQPRKKLFSFVESATDMCGNSNEKPWKIWSYVVVILASIPILSVPLMFSCTSHPCQWNPQNSSNPKVLWLSKMKLQDSPLQKSTSFNLLVAQPLVIELVY